MAGIFISYRSSALPYSNASLFRDVGTNGVDFLEAIERSVEQCDVPILGDWSGAPCTADAREIVVLGGVAPAP